MTKEKSAGEGFRRGFLLSKPKKKKKTPVEAVPVVPKTRKADSLCFDQAEQIQTLQPKPSCSSSALLDLEGTSTTTSNSSRLLHVIEDGNHEKTKSTHRTKNPLVVLDMGENDAHDETNVNQESSMGLVEISSSTIRRKKGSLISEVFPNNAPVVLGIVRAEDGVEISRIPTELDRPVLLNQSLESTTPANVHDLSMNAGNSITGPAREEVESTTNFLQCQQNLDRTLWKLRRKRRRKDSAHGDDNEWRPIAAEFCSRLMCDDNSQQDTTTTNPELLSWVWDSLLMACPKKSSQCMAEMRLGLVLLESTRTPTAWKAFAHFLRPEMDKRHRVGTLGAVTVLDFWCASQQKQHTILSPTWLIDLLNNILVPLGQQLAGQSTRTILAQRCMTGIYSIVSTSVEYIMRRNSVLEGDLRKDVQQALWKASNDTLRQAWNTQMAWTVNADGREDDDELETRRTMARKACTEGLLQNWKELLRELNNHGDTGRACEQWCRLLRGVEMHDNGLRVGSLRQTLLKSEIVLNEEDAVLCLTRALKCGKEFFVGGKDPSAEDSDDQVLLVLGVVAWLGQSKNLRISLHQEFFELSSSLVLFSMSGFVVNLAVHIL